MEAIVASLIGLLTAMSAWGLLQEKAWAEEAVHAARGQGAGTVGVAARTAVRRLDLAVAQSVERMPATARRRAVTCRDLLAPRLPDWWSAPPYASIAVCAAACGLAVALLGGSWAGFAAGCIGFVAVLGVESAREEKRSAEKIEKELPEAFRALSISLGSGHSLARAMRYVGSHADGVIKVEFMRVGMLIDCGTSATVALDELLARMPTHGMDMVALALKVSKRTGAPLSGLLAEAACWAGDRIELRRTLDVKTAQARMSAHIVSAMPVAMMLFLLSFSADFRAGAATLSGALCIGVAVALNAVAVAVITRIMRLEL